MQAIPAFYLYGEPHQSVTEGFVHIEALDDRTRPSEWTIRPHSHVELCHIFYVNAGGGDMQADGEAIALTAPCLLLVPANVVHGFRWSAESSGFVVTLAKGYFLNLTRRDAAIGRLFEHAGCVSLESSQAEKITALIEELMRELGWSLPGYASAIDSMILQILVIALRALGHQRDAQSPFNRHSVIVARFRERVERRFRLREPIPVHAEALGVSLTVLRVACAEIAGCAPSLLLDQRAMLEAKRALLYTTLSINEIGYSVGFTDPAYFSRFFTRHAGVAPREYREQKKRRAERSVGC